MIVLRMFTLDMCDRYSAFAAPTMDAIPQLVVSEHILGGEALVQGYVNFFNRTLHELIIAASRPVHETFGRR